MRKYLRDIEKVQFGHDSIYPVEDLGDAMLYTETRKMAIIEVLRCLPEEDYKKLSDKADLFEWFIPMWIEYGRIHPFPITPQSQERRYVKVLYLSPILEEKPIEISIAVVAHELAHIFKGHKTHCKHQWESDAQEAIAWDIVVNWGFKKELKVYEKERKKQEDEDEDFMKRFKKEPKE